MSDDEMNRLFDVELTEKETFFIGRIVALWGALEHEIFMQTLQTFAAEGDAPIKLPSEMNNIQFTGVLGLWKTRVVDLAKGKRKRVLEQQHEEILRCHEFRKAVVHGMWDWSAQNVGNITSTRIVGKKIIGVKFTADSLLSFMTDMQKINFSVRYPRGLSDYALAMSKQGFGISRRFAAAMTGHPVADELRPPDPPEDEHPLGRPPEAV